MRKFIIMHSKAVSKPRRKSFSIYTNPSVCYKGAKATYEDTTVFHKLVKLFSKLFRYAVKCRADDGFILIGISVLGENDITFEVFLIEAVIHISYNIIITKLFIDGKPLKRT